MPLLLGTVLLAACATPPGGGTALYTSSERLSATGSDVTVEVDAQGVSAERMPSYVEHGGSKVIGDAILEELRSTEKPGRSGAYTLRVSVIGFRLRSSSSGFWLGAMAGADQLKASVAVVVGDEVEKSFHTDVSTVVAGMIRPGSMNRFTRMAAALAQRIVAGL